MTGIQIVAMALFMVAVSVAYFFLDTGERNLRVRVLVSAHGLVAALLFFGALAIWTVTRAYRPWAAWPFLFLHLLPVISILYALFFFKGPKLLHLTQIPNVACMFYTMFVGGMAITGDWL